MCSAHFWKRIFEKMHFEKMTCVMFWGGPTPNFRAVTPSSENQKDAQRSCDQFPGSIASRWLL